MCLGIPGQVVALLDDTDQLARVDVTGVTRTINVGLVTDEGLKVGDWVLGTRTRSTASASTVLKGVLKPWECKVFGTACTPETPIGTCMVSSEGACAAYYNYGRYAKKRLPAVV